MASHEMQHHYNKYKEVPPPSGVVSFFVTQKGIKEKMAVIASLDLFLLTSKGWSDSICGSSSDESKRLRKQDKSTDGRSFDP